jgi:hypothetical protein
MNFQRYRRRSMVLRNISPKFYNFHSRYRGQCGARDLTGPIRDRAFSPRPSEIGLPRSMAPPVYCFNRVKDLVSNAPESPSCDLPSCGLLRKVGVFPAFAPNACRRVGTVSARPVAIVTIRHTAWRGRPGCRRRAAGPDDHEGLYDRHGCGQATTEPAPKVLSADVADVRYLLRAGSLPQGVPCVGGFCSELRGCCAIGARLQKAKGRTQCAIGFLLAHQLTTAQIDCAICAPLVSG